MELELQIFAIPTITFVPADEATGVLNEEPTITLTFSEAVRNLDDTVITDAMLADKIDFKVSDENGEDVDCEMTINAGKTVVTIVPDSELTPGTEYYIGVLADSFENITEDVVVAENITFTTSDTIDLTGNKITLNSIVSKALVAGDVDGNNYFYQANDEKTIIVAYNSSADTAYDLIVKAPENPGYAGKDLSDITEEIPFGQIAVISVESARYADVTGKINVDVENAAIKLTVFYKD